MKNALITGVLGQDGSYMAEYLLSLGYNVFGLTRRSPETAEWTKRLLDQDITFLYGDMTDRESLEVAIWKSKPDEIYNFAGQVFVPVSWVHPGQTFDVNVGGLARILEIVARRSRETRVYQATSSEIFGNAGVDAHEGTVPIPVSPYGVSKFAAHELCNVYRQAGLFVASGICFNHESPRRGSEMVTQKIAKHVARWVMGDKTKLMLGSLDSCRDWGYAKDYVEAMHLMLQDDTPTDYVIGTGTTHSVKDFVYEAVAAADLPAYYTNMMVVEDKRLVRTNDVQKLRANPLLINSRLKWKSKTSFGQLVKIMVDSEVSRLRNQLKRLGAAQGTGA